MVRQRRCATPPNESARSVATDLITTIFAGVKAEMPRCRCRVYVKLRAPNALLQTRFGRLYDRCRCSLIAHWLGKARRPSAAATKASTTAATWQRAPENTTPSKSRLHVQRKSPTRPRQAADPLSVARSRGPQQITQNVQPTRTNTHNTHTTINKLIPTTTHTCITAVNDIRT